MNQKDRFIERSKHLRLLKMGQKRNCVRLNTTNNLLHELEKTRVCYELQSMGMEYISEADFKTGGRADIFVLDNGTVFEVLHSESLKAMREKTKKYPAGLTIIPLMAGAKP